MQRGEPDTLDAWIRKAQDSGIYSFQRFAKTLRRDLPAVHNALIEPFSNGPVEGHIIRKVSATMSDDRVVLLGSQSASSDMLTSLLREKAQLLLQAAIEAEFEELLGRYGEVRELGGRKALVRNGHLPERTVLTGLGEIAVKVPRVRDRTGSGHSLRVEAGARSMCAGQIRSMPCCHGCICEASRRLISGRLWRHCWDRRWRTCRAV